MCTVKAYIKKFLNFKMEKNKKIKKQVTFSYVHFMLQLLNQTF